MHVSKLQNGLENGLEFIEVLAIKMHCTAPRTKPLNVCANLQAWQIAD